MIIALYSKSIITASPAGKPFQLYINIPPLYPRGAAAATLPTTLLYLLLIGLTPWIITAGVIDNYS